jgi:hypothetical protein
VALAGIVAPVGFFTVMTVLGQVTPDYDWVARYGSELSLGSLGWIMIVNFVALGLVELALAAALGRTIGNKISGWVATAAGSSRPHLSSPVYASPTQPRSSPVRRRGTASCTP